MSSDLFKGEVAIVTGAGQGIGFEIAKMLSASGASLILNDFDTALSNQAAISIQQNGGICISMPGDASNPDFIQTMVDTALEKFGSLSIVVANAGLSLYNSFLEFTPEDLNQVLQLNLGGSFFLAQKAAKSMIKLQKGGSVLFTGSVCGHLALQDLAAYSMTKAALEMLAKNLVLELSPYNIRVNVIAPGATVTERTATFPDYEKEWAAITPLQKPAYVQDIANAASFLLSPKAGHITGQSLIIDGGWTSVGRPPVYR